MIAAIALLLVCQLSGEVLVRLLELPLPGPVAGLVLLAAGLGIRHAVRRRQSAPDTTGEGPGNPVPAEVHGVAHGILRHLSLLFVPAAVGIVQQADLLRTHGLGLTAALAVSTLAAMVVTALVFRGLSRWSNGAASPQREGDRP